MNGYVPPDPERIWIQGILQAFAPQLQPTKAMVQKFAQELREVFAELWPVIEVITPKGAYVEEMQARGEEAKKGQLLKSSQYAREEMKKLQKIIDASPSIEQLEAFRVSYREQLKAIPWQDELRAYYEARKQELRHAVQS